MEGGSGGGADEKKGREVVVAAQRGWKAVVAAQRGWKAVVAGHTIPEAVLPCINYPAFIN